MKTDARSPSRGTAAASRPPARSSEERARRRNELRRSATDVYRRAILEAAEREFSGRSFAETKMADIARRAGLASGTLYNYFDSKEAIFQSLIEARGDELAAGFDAVASQTLIPMARLRAFMEAALAHLEQHRQMFLFLVQMGPLAGLGFEKLAGAAAERTQRRCMKHLEQAVREAQKAGVLREDVAPLDLVHFFAGTIHGHVRAWLMAGGKKGVVARAPDLINLFLDGAATRE
jgi:AcrR family transcriptional regulator